MDDTFIMVGGRLDFGLIMYSDKLIKYLPETGAFMELPGKMKLPRNRPTAILVDRSIFPPCTDGGQISSVAFALMIFAPFVNLLM